MRFESSEVFGVVHMAGYVFKDIERKMRAHWKSIGLLDRINAQNAKGEKYFLLDGPPYANAQPHVGHIRNTVYKDLYLRYAQLCGKDTLFQPGFDTHGLPIENAVEKKLGLSSKQDIKKLGVSTFIRPARRVPQAIWISGWGPMRSSARGMRGRSPTSRTRIRMWRVSGGGLRSSGTRVGCIGANAPCIGARNAKQPLQDTRRRIRTRTSPILPL
ncbi:MAG: class I tRNA ligase family protein [Nitrosarchaeum sp.]|nr:class I tRNA ligase family protein [Nitrosarchaeum sp.]